MRIKKHIKTYFYITLGVTLIALAYYFFFLPENLVTGGVTGIAIICNKAFGESFSPSLLIYALNAILLIVGLLLLGRDFFLKTIYGSLLLPTITGLLELFNVNSAILFTIDNVFFSTDFSELSKVILSVIFGSIITAIGLGICFKNNATTGGMDVVQKVIAKYLHFPYSKTIYVTDGIVVIFALCVFGVERTLYGVICIFLIGVVLDYIAMGGKPRRTMFIISEHYLKIKDIIIKRLARGVTIVPATGGYSEKSYSMLVCTLSKSESYLMRDLIYDIDPNAFMFYVSAKEVYGDGFE